MARRRCVKALCAGRTNGAAGTASGLASRVDLGVLLAALALAAPARAELSHVTRLSDEFTVTRSATPYRDAIVRADPAGRARGVGRLRRFTEDGYAERYLVLSEGRDDRGRMWAKLRLPARPNGRTGWVPRAALGPYRTTRTALVIDRRRLRATYYFDGQERWHAPVGIGAPATPTPRGRFWIREQFPVRGGGLYGVYAFGTSAYAAITDWPGGAVVGIHGTDAPELIPGRPSHGCIRLRNADIRWLAKRLPDGAPVAII